MVADGQELKADHNLSELTTQLVRIVLTENSTPVAGNSLKMVQILLPLLETNTLVNCKNKTTNNTTAIFSRN